MTPFQKGTMNAVVELAKLQWVKDQCRSTKKLYE
jgi:hypothetical protein